MAPHTCLRHDLPLQTEADNKIVLKVPAVHVFCKTACHMSSVHNE